METIDWSLFDNTETETKNAACCDVVDMYQEGGYMVCQSCGRGDTDSAIFEIDIYDSAYIKKMKQPYRRIVYFRQKIALLCNESIYPKCPRIVHFIDQNRGRHFRSIRKLRRAMKAARLHKFYKYIYCIYFEITGVSLINLSQAIKNGLISNFMKIEKLFMLEGARKNLYSYNIIIYCLLKLGGYDGYTKMLLPHNKAKIKKLLEHMISPYVPTR